MLTQQFAHTHHRCSDVCCAVYELNLNNQRNILINKTKQYTFYFFLFVFSTLLLTKDFIKQIYDALFSLCFPLISWFSGLTLQARGGFLSLLIGRGFPVSATFPFIHRALLFSPFQNNSLSPSLGSGSAWTGLIT